MIRKVLAVVAIAVVGLLGVVGLAGLSDYSIDERNVENVTFSVEGNRLSGSVVLPEGDGPFPFVVLVHGDGAATRFLDSTLLPFVNALVDAGFGVFSWDKPGVGQSEGDWLKQSMADRSQEAIAAYQLISEHPQAQSSAVGFLGFSQAGWVVPEAAKTVNPAFTVTIGAAMNWRDQSA